MKKILRFFTSVSGWIFTIICSGVIIGSIAALLIFNHYTEDLPDYSTLEQYNPPTISRVYAKDGRLISEIAKQKRIYAPLRVVPSQVVHAFLSAEDKNFYSHTGIDYRGIARAVFTNIVRYGDNRGLVGGSTITQQVVKNFLLTNERSIKRKIREAVLAIRITNAYSKDRILELYLNEIYLGHHSYGIAAAAMNYFNRSLSELSLEETALLAALPKAPSHLNPHKNYDKALERRNWVLGRMYDDNRISKEEMLAAQASPIELRKRDKQETVNAPYFASEVKSFLIKELGKKVVNEGGLSVITTLDPELQAKADKALRNQLISYDRKRGYRGGVGKLEHLTDIDRQLKKHKARGQLVGEQRLAVVLSLSDGQANITLNDNSTGILPMKLLKWTRRSFSDGTLGPVIKTPADILNVGDVIIVGKVSDADKKKLPEEQSQFAWDLQQVPLVNGATVVSDPHSGKILALSGGYSFNVSSYNRATQAKRQPGSAFKPFVYLSGLENGMTPSTLVMDGRIELADGADGEVWRPENYADTYLGPTTLRRGLEKSRNTMSVRLGQALGMKRVMEVGKRFGIYDKARPNLSMVLGTLETSVIRLLNGYATIANGGRKVSPILVERVEDRHGNVIYSRDLRGCPTCKVDGASWTPHALKPPALFDPRERIVDARIAYQMTEMLQGVVKRGTAASAASMPWALGGKTGTTNESRDTWFMGISPNLIAGVFIGFDTPAPLGSKYTGSSMALPVFKEFMQAALEGTDKVEFPAPSGLKRTKVALNTGSAIEPWEDDGRRTIWEVFLRDDVPMFKPDTLLALGELTQTQTAKLGVDLYGPKPPILLPWQIYGGEIADPAGSYSDYQRQQALPPRPSYAPPRYIPQQNRGVYVPQIQQPIRAPRQRHLPVAPTTSAPQDQQSLY